MKIPTVHLNGTSKAELIQQVSDAAAALDEALSWLRGAYPHGRDYYPQGEHALREAQLDHLVLQTKLVEVREAVMELWAGIAAQPDNR
jgi:hypothetical protein